MFKRFAPGPVQRPVPFGDCETCLYPGHIRFLGRAPDAAVIQIFEQQRLVRTGVDGQDWNPPVFEQGVDFWFERIRSIKPFQDMPTTFRFYAVNCVSGFGAQEFGGEDI